MGLELVTFLKTQAQQTAITANQPQPKTAKPPTAALTN